MIVEQDISEIVIGTYIVDIVEQRGNYNLARADWVKSDAVIARLKNKGIERVLVDPAKQRNPEPAPDGSTTEQPSFLEQITQAQVIFDESKIVLRKLFDDAKSGIMLDLAPVKEVIDESIEVIFKNPDALACVINIRQKDQYLLEHSISVSILITMLGLHLSIDKKIVKELSVGAFLHDVGKIKVPDKILNKPGSLTEDEFEIMKNHVTHSVDSIRDTPGISAISLEVVALHHEKLNGQGYPYGSGEERISIYGRMITICDIFDALTANRCYKESYQPVKAFTILRSLAQDKQLDPTLVDKFIKCIGVYPVGSIVKLNSNRLALVERRNKQDPVRPRVITFYSLNQKCFEPSKEVDLSTAKDERIVKSVRADDFDLNLQQIIEFLANDNQPIFAS